MEIVHDRFTRDTRDTKNTTVQANHTYYSSTYYPASSPVAATLWQDLAPLVDGGGAVVDHFTESQLSGLHRYYEVHPLKFDFPFYGHTLDSVAVTTGGFLYTGDLLHEQVTFSQFIAPLQADFNPNHTDTGRVLVLSTESRFTVQWDKVHNHDHLNDGPFTFQVSLFPSGEIHFVYLDIPLPLDKIDNEDHPVQVGLSDAYYIYQNGPDGLVVHILRYDRVSLHNSTNLNNSAYVLHPVLNCVVASSCQECANISRDSAFDCGWCSDLNRCSDGIDRYRQVWLRAGCHQEQRTSCTESKSSGLATSTRVGIGVGVLLLVLLIALVLLATATFLYAYRRPTSRMGQFIIKHRPKARSLNKNTASSTSYEVSSEKATLEED
jgi:hypothetical protein